MKKVSVVIPVYNMEDKIVKCVESMLKQTYSNIEIILIDDGSKDKSYLKCKELSLQFINVSVFHTSNQGSGPARNYGITKASGDYVYFPDADDFLESTAIEVLVESMSNNNCDLVVFGYRNVNLGGKTISEKKFKPKSFSGEEIRRNYEMFFTMDSDFGIQGAPWNKFFDLHKIKEHAIEFPPLRRHQDEVFISRYICYTENVCFIDHIFYTYLTNDLNKVWDKYPVNYLEIIYQLKQYRDETIVSWNPQNKIVIDIVEREYICNIIKALELSFSNKMRFNKKERKIWIIQAVLDANLREINLPLRYQMRYQRLIISLIHRGNIKTLYWALSGKVFLEKNLYSVFAMTKRMI